MLRDWPDRDNRKQILFAFDAAYAADPYRVHSIVTGAADQLGTQFDRIQLFCEGNYRGPRFSRNHPRVVPVRTPPGWSPRVAALRATRRLRLAESPARWLSNVAAPLEPLLRSLAANRTYDSVITFSRSLAFAITVFRLAHIFASVRMPRLLAVVPASTADAGEAADIEWLGAVLLCDGELAAGTGSPTKTTRQPGHGRDPVSLRFAEASPLRFTHASTYPSANREPWPTVCWADCLADRIAPRPPPRDVVLFVRPDWANCGSATTFNSLARYFHDNGALLIDIAIWPYGGTWSAADRDARITEEQRQIGAALYFSIRRSASLLRIGAELVKAAIGLPPTTIVRQKLLQYALAARPAILASVIGRARISHIYLNHFFTHRYARSFIGRRRFFLDTHDIQSVNWVQGGAVNFITGRGDLFHTLLRDELRILSQAHRLSFVNQEELALAQTVIPREKLDLIVALPPILPCEPAMPADPPRLLVVASNNLPNKRGLQWFLESVWPLIQAAFSHPATPDRPARPPILDICGNIAAEFIDARFSSCIFHGPVEDLRAFYTRADAVLLPVVIGSGIAIKAIEAILHGRPVVATSQALRGLPDEVVQCIGHANAANEFATAVLNLVTSPSDRRIATARVAAAAAMIRQQGYYERLDAAMAAVRTPTAITGQGFRPAIARTVPGDIMLDRVRHMLARYFLAGERSKELVADPRRIAFDGDPAWLAQIFANRTVHDEDYRVFGHFQDPQSLILDIGANYGYSVASMFAQGCGSCVLSFEPVEALATCLAEVVRLNPGRCDYRMLALGGGAGTQAFVMPVLNNRAITSLTTADARPDIDSLARNICSYHAMHMREEPFLSLAFHAFTAPVRTLDAALREGGPFCVPTSKIVAAKIDAEGTEAAIVAGALDTFSAHRPLILIEGANRQAMVREMLQGVGYEFAIRCSDQLSLSNTISQLANGFFVHATRFKEYRTCGLLCG